jgi:hypothetical protein
LLVNGYAIVNGEDLDGPQLNSTASIRQASIRQTSILDSTDKEDLLRNEGN